MYYRPKECSYEDLLNCFFNSVDPTTKNRQGMDMGTQYRSGIYYHNDAQKQAAEKVSLSGLPLSSFPFYFVVPCRHVPCAQTLRLRSHRCCLQLQAPLNPN